VIITFTPNPGLDRTLTVPRITFNEMTRASGLRLDWGGKGLNVSRALHALGTESVAIGFLGGATGKRLEQGLAEMGIATDFLHIAGETRTNTVITEAETGRYVKVNEAGPTLRAEEVATFYEQARERVRPGDVWVLSGSLPPGAPPDFYAQLIALVQASGAKALLDSSGDPLRRGCTASPYLVKPNVIEAGQMTGQAIHSDAEALAAVKFFLQQDIHLVALSLGAAGLLLADQDQVVQARPPRVQARNPVGSGDALLAGIASALARVEGRPPLDEIARWGVAAGTAAAVREGVSVGSRSQVEALYEQVQTTRVG